MIQSNNNYYISISREKIVNTYLTLTSMKSILVLSSYTTYQRVCNQSCTSEAGTAYPSGAPKSTPGFQWDSHCSIFIFLCIILQIVVCPLSFCFCSWCCMLFFNLWILITVLVSANPSYTNKNIWPRILYTDFINGDFIVGVMPDDILTLFIICDDLSSYSCLVVCVCASYYISLTFD